MDLWYCDSRLLGAKKDRKYLILRRNFFVDKRYNVDNSRIAFLHA